MIPCEMRFNPHEVKLKHQKIQKLKKTTALYWVEVV